ncbi:hypothetical protein PG994_000606 [Apiospora phragmitis]|uniref:Fe2OG dioxygenase domain-containing protein n=1 Tax=Apiospora phragmitis TaxID=2905665 RepID=A0ABR1X6M5_9PEZI
MASSSSSSSSETGRAAKRARHDSPDDTKNEPLEGLRSILKEQNHTSSLAEALFLSMSPERRKKKQHDPITIRWDVNDNDATPYGQVAEPCAKLTLPPLAGVGAGALPETSLKRLIQNCQPATFGRGAEDVYDKSYRLAGKMDPAAFCTTFDPYAAGIVDTVAQVLLPSVYDSATHRGVHAELYKLNVYSGPSGKFKAHVDTPRSRGQFGSLVVCLPVEHEGGQLQVRHKGEETTSSSGTNNKKEDNNKPSCHRHRDFVHWAAFYSDCEHEVLEVTRGHRITLTYNLYAVRGFGRLTGAALSPKPLNPAHLLLFDTIQRTVSQDPFGGQGGTLGFWCSHAYAYNHATESPLPNALKGVDAVLWEVFQALGLDPKIAPVMAMDEDNIEFLREWYEKHPDHKADTDADAKATEMPPSEWIIGHKFGDIDVTDQVEDFEEYIELYSAFGKYSLAPIHWLNKAPRKREMQMIYIAFPTSEA